jgi:hypothetical protein
MRRGPKCASALLVLLVAGCTYLSVQHRTKGDRQASLAVLEVGMGASATLTVSACDGGLDAARGSLDAASSGEAGLGGPGLADAPHERSAGENGVEAR